MTAWCLVRAARSGWRLLQHTVHPVSGLVSVCTCRRGSPSGGPSLCVAPVHRPRHTVVCSADLAVPGESSLPGPHTPNTPSPPTRCSPSRSPSRSPSCPPRLPAAYTAAQHLLQFNIQGLPCTPWRWPWPRCWWGRRWWWGRGRPGPAAAPAPGGLQHCSVEQRSGAVQYQALGGRAQSPAGRGAGAPDKAAGARSWGRTSYCLPSLSAEQAE